MTSFFFLKKNIIIDTNFLPVSLYLEMDKQNLVCLKVSSQLFFKVFFTWKYIKIIFFLFFKNYF